MGKGRAIKRIREARGMTQAQLADLAGITDGGLRGYELDRRVPRAEHRLRIAEALGVAPEALVDHGLADPDVFAHALLDLEGTEAAPVVEADERGALLRVGGVHGAFLEDWLGARSRLESGEMSREEYERWRDGYVAKRGGDDGDQG